MFALARIIRLAATVVATLLVVGILLVVFDAKPTNDVVEWFTDTARDLAGPFHTLFDLDSPKWQVGLNWGLAAVVYLAVSRLIARLLTR